MKSAHAVKTFNCGTCTFGREWLIENLTIERAQALCLYDFERGGWMQGQPARRLHFKNIQATHLARATRVLGESGRWLPLTLENVSLTLGEENGNQPVLDVNQFDSLTLQDVRLANSGAQPVLTATRGNRVRIKRLTAVPANQQPYHARRGQTFSTAFERPRGRSAWTFAEVVSSRRAASPGCGQFKEAARDDAADVGEDFGFGAAGFPDVTKKRAAILVRNRKMEDDFPRHFRSRLVQFPP